MSRKKISVLIVFTLSLFAFFNLSNYYYKNTVLTKLLIDLKTSTSMEVQLFYSNSSDKVWSEEKSSTQLSKNVDSWESFEFNIPKDTKFIRLDTGKQPGDFEIANAAIKGTSTIAFPKTEILNAEKHQINKVVDRDSVLNITSVGEDPYIVLNVKNYIDESLKTYNSMSLIVCFIISSILSVMVTCIVSWGKEVKAFSQLFISNKSLIYKLAKNDFKTKYASSYLGIVWGFVQPVVMILTYWFVFEVGLRAGGVSNVPFILWFIAGIIPWFFISDVISSGTNVFIEYSYLVKKVVFKIEVLPVVKIVSALFVHVFFVVFLFIVYYSYGFPIQLIHVQMIYYILCSIVLTLGLTLFASAVVLFFRDLNQIIAIILQIGFWFTPIGWSYEMVPQAWLWLFKLNPVFYIVEGFRDTLVHDIYFFERPYHTLYFWMFSLFAIGLAVKMFKRLKPHFSDVI